MVTSHTSARRVLYRVSYLHSAIYVCLKRLVRSFSFFAAPPVRSLVRGLFLETSVQLVVSSTVRLLPFSRHWYVLVYLGH